MPTTLEALPVTDSHKVLLADAVAEDAERVFLEEGVAVDNRPGMERNDQLSALADCTGMVVRSSTTVDEAMMDAAPNLKVIGRAGSGVDNIDVTAATDRGILVMNAPGENTLSAAEHAWAMLMAMARNIPTGNQKMTEGQWGKKGLMGVELGGKTIGVLGLGRIGREVCGWAKSFGMTVLGYDPFLPKEIAEKMGIELCELEDIWPRAQFLTLHTPLTDRTRHMVDADSLAACPDGVRIVNCARGGLVDEAALLAALESGKVAGAAFDVFEQEPPVEDHPLRSHPQVVCTPHLGASTTEAQEKVAFRIAEQMSAYLKEGIVRNAVNMPSVEAEVAERLKPWQKLAGTIGHMQAHLLDGGLTEVEVEVSGDLVELPQGAITSAVLEGLLGHLLNQSVNRVNAESVAREHGYTIKEVQGQDTDGYAGLLSVTLRSDSGEHIIQGAVFGERYPKVVRVDRWYLESDAKGDLLLVVNEDTPGRLAAITAVIADSGANVADLALGRDKATGTALNAIHLDGPLTEDALERVGAIDGVAWVRQLALTP